MQFRKSEKCDIDEIMKIIKQAQIYFKENGIDQWQNNYPNPDTIKNDIDNGVSYVLIKDDKIVGTTVISFDGESTYNHIYDGQWLSNEKYAVIHRIAINNDYKGMALSSKIINYTEEICRERNVNSIKVDTHKDNISMQKLLEKNDFKYCGKIILNDGAERIAFERILS